MKKIVIYILGLIFVLSSFGISFGSTPASSSNGNAMVQTKGKHNKHWGKRKWRKHRRHHHRHHKKG